MIILIDSNITFFKIPFMINKKPYNTLGTEGDFNSIKPTSGNLPLIPLNGEEPDVFQLNWEHGKDDPHHIILESLS